MKRSPLPRRKRGIHAGRRSPRWVVRSTGVARFHDEVEKRAGGKCEVGLLITSDPNADLHRVPHRCRKKGDQAHHVVPRSRGVGWAGLHEPENGLWVCAPCHQWIHANPATSKALGLLKSAPR